MDEARAPPVRGQGPPRDLIKAHEERNARKPDTAGTSTSRGSRRRPGRVDSTSLTSDKMEMSVVKRDEEICLPVKAGHVFRRVEKFDWRAIESFQLRDQNSFKIL